MPIGSIRLNTISDPYRRTPNSITANADAQVSTAQSKFGGASALFDGTGDYLITANPLPLGTGELTLECWIFTDHTSQQTPMGVYTGGGTELGAFIDLSASGVPRVRFGTTSATGSTAINDNAWHHVAGVRTASGIKLYVDGVEVASAAANNANLTLTPGFSVGRLDTSLTRYFDGYIDEVRVSNIARYTAGFTPSTTPFINDVNTLLLLHMDGTNGSQTFLDDVGLRQQTGVSGIGNADISTAESKFGGSSAFFDGTGDLLQSVESYLNVAANDFTIEGWVRFSATTGDRGLFTKYESPGPYGFNIRYAASVGGIRSVFGSGSTNNAFNKSWSPATNTWYHVACVRSGTSYRIYVDGTEIGSSQTITVTVAGTNEPFTIGRAQTVANSDFSGYMDEIRVSNTARYTGNFTAPTAPFVNDGYTLLLLHMDGANDSTTFVDDDL